MRPEEIIIGRTYAGGKNGDLRVAVSYGADRNFICFAPPNKRLPYGGFLSTTCVSIKAFAKWATAEVFG